MWMLRACLLLLSMMAPAFGQAGPERRIDVLTGEPVRPRSERPDPVILNAPHAPRQQQSAEAPPLEIYVAPQIGSGIGTGIGIGNGLGTGYGANDTATGSPQQPGMGRSLRQYRREARDQPGQRRFRDTAPIFNRGNSHIFDRIRE